uniref:Nuclear receptor n=1 Tax=Brachionus rotundiformis TaxID=96890 RepID=A0A221CAX4_9BILA|nr:nuclear receptor [Brachionus rotundiformis]
MVLSEQKIFAALCHENFLNKNRVNNSKYEAIFNFGECKICQDKATGIHYGVASCEGCKGFFKRSLLRHKNYICKGNRKCKIHPRERKKCKFCRWKLCISSGMSVLEVRIGRIPNRLKQIKPKIKTNHNDKIAFQNLEYFLSLTKLDQFKLSTIQILPKLKESFNFSTHNKLIILSLLRNKAYQIFKEHDTCLDSSSILFPDYQLVQRDKKIINELRTIFLADLTKHAGSMFQFVHELPGFQKMSKHDLGIMISESFFSALVIRTAKIFKDEYFFFILNDKLVLNSELFGLMTSPLVRDVMFEFYWSINNLGLLDQEFALLIPIFLCIFSFRRNLEQPEAIKDLGVYYTEALVYEFLLNNRNNDFIQKFAKVISLAPKVNQTCQEMHLII